MKDFMSQAAKLLKEHKLHRRQMKVFLCLAVIVAFGTVTALKLYGQAMTHTREVLDCEYEVHEHTEECYEKDEQGNPGTELICGYADYVIHVHNGEDCYDQKGNLVCTLEEHEKHEHTEECYVTETVLVCGLEEATGAGSPADDGQDVPDEAEGTDDAADPAEGTENPDDEADPTEGTESPADTANPAVQEKVLACGAEEHTHNEDCYEKALSCAYAEEHTHDDSCKSRELTCREEEHTHGAKCVDADGNSVCESEEHTHGEMCYEETDNCGKEEHVHDDSCYTSNLICDIAEHEHTESCYEMMTVPGGATEPTGEAPAAPEGGIVETAEDADDTSEKVHVHTDECYEEVTRLVCEELELHTHDDSCYDEECFDKDGDLIEGSRVSCGLLQLEEHVHVHKDAEVDADGNQKRGCFKTVELTPEEVAALENGAKLHIHKDSCYDEEGKLICGHDATHIHMPQCYDDAGKLICGYGTASHVHEDSCYDKDGKLQCGYETASHVHEDSCYDKDGKLQCGYETASHVHEDSCYDKDGKLQCGYETASHVHEDSCYDKDGKLQCGYETASHLHEEDCYDEDGNLICGYETASHLHEEDCYDEDGNLICGYKTASHPHTEDCYDEEGNLICGYETATHVHNENCYDEDGNVICGYAAAVHEHEHSCYDEEGNLICGYNKNGFALEALYCNELIHQHEDSCYDEEGNVICGKADFAVHTHTDECYNVEGKKICPLTETEAHVHSEECYPEEAEGEMEPICGKEEIELHTHTEECYNANGKLTCGQMEVLEHFHSEDCKVSIKPITKKFENDSFIVTAVYKPDANIPSEAKLVVEQITEENDGEHYAKRQAEYQEALGDDKATMRALLKIGFYVNGEEVEPESPVTVTIQFLDEDGLAEGRSITVIHFAEEGTELLEGSKAEGGRTTFEMGSFSEIAVGYGVENVKVPVNEELKYETDEIEVIFHIEGEVSVPLDWDSKEESKEDAGEDNSGATETETESTDVPVEDAEGETATDSPEEDSKIAEGGVSVEIQNTNLEKKLEFRVDPLKEDSEEYIEASKLYSDGTEESIEENADLLFLEVVSYRVVYDGKKLDLTDCIVTAEVIPSEALVEYAETAVTPMTLELDDQESVQEADLTPEVTITIAGAGEDGIIDGFTVNQTARTAPTSVLLGNSGIATFSGTSQANPEFTVEFYAEIDTFAIPDAADKETIKVIDTSGKKLPKNEEALKTKNIKVNEDGTVKTVKEEREIYSAGTYHYVTEPGLVYFNKIAKNDNYILKMIKVKRQGSEDWEEYECWEGEGENKKKKEWHFTNKSKTQEDNPNDFILITEGATIRLVHEAKERTVSNGADFYDYDISNGNLYKSATVPKGNDKEDENILVTRGDATTHNSGDTWYMYTNRQGINSSVEDQTFGFGNSEGTMRTTMGEIEGNRANAANVAYGSPTFGLVTGLQNGIIQYKKGVKAPNLFNEGGAKGKTQYAGDLIFSQKGDTYTLTGAEVKEKGEVVSSKYNIDKFTRQRYNWNKTYYFAGNDFYPLDGVSSAGTAGHDLMFGATDCSKLKNYGGYSINDSNGNPKWTLDAPASDDGQNHNHYFGMHYTVEFDLVEDYVGPLEYLFYGDDDMWVFLEGDGASAELICDIGGVHSSVGEYVDLWDYIQKGSEGHYKLTFFYTERGASGSTCWMQFTLPSVSFATTEQDTGELRIEKKVTGDETTDEEFGFEIQFNDAAGKPLRDDFSYTKFGPTGNVIADDILIWNNSKFTLKAGQYIVIKFLPDGSTYTIKEVGPVTYEPSAPGEGIEWKEKDDNPYIPEITGGEPTSVGVVTGSIEKDNCVEIVYNNVKRFALPETGGTGTIIYTMAGGIVLLFGAGFLYKKKFRERRA